MDMDKLRVFVDVCSMGTFAAAAQAHYMSHQAVSKCIKSLENELGVSLFVRTSRGIELTEAGEILRKSADKILVEYDRCKRKLLSRSQAEMTGSIKIGFSYDTEYLMSSSIFENNYFALNFVEQLRLDFPLLRISSGTYPFEELEKLVVNGGIDIGYCLAPMNSEKYKISPLFSLPLTLVIGSEHRLYGKEIFLDDLSGEHLLVADERFQFGTALAELMKTFCPGSMDVSRSFSIQTHVEQIISGEYIYCGRLPANYSVNYPQLAEQLVSDQMDFFQVVEFALPDREGPALNSVWDYAINYFTQQLRNAEP